MAPKAKKGALKRPSAGDVATGRGTDAKNLARSSEPRTSMRGSNQPLGTLPRKKPWILKKSQQMKDNSLFSGRWAAAGLSKPDYDEIYAKFVASDANEDGKLSREEFQEAAPLLEFIGMSEVDVSGLFTAVDADQSGFVDWEEFLYYMSLRKDHSPLASQKDTEMKRLDANIKRLGFDLCVTDDGLRGVPGDGNCQFYSLSWKLKGKLEQATEVRTMIIEQLRMPAVHADLVNLFKEIRDPAKPRSFTTYLKRMAKDAEWGDDITLQAAADAFHVQINVLTSAAYDPLCPPRDGGAFGAVQFVKPGSGCAKDTIWLAFAAQHYSPIDPTSSTPQDIQCLRHDASLGYCLGLRHLGA